MALPSSGQISMSQIATEKQGFGAGSGQSFRDISLKGVSVDGVNDFAFFNGDSVIGPLDITGTPNSATPYGMAEFHGYSQFAWGTPGSITTNAADMFDIQRENQNGNSCAVATGIYIKHILASKRLDFC